MYGLFPPEHGLDYSRPILGHRRVHRRTRVPAAGRAVGAVQEPALVKKRGCSYWGLAGMLAGGSKVRGLAKVRGFGVSGVRVGTRGSGRHANGSVGTGGAHIDQHVSVTVVWHCGAKQITLPWLRLSSAI